MKAYTKNLLFFLFFSLSSFAEASPYSRGPSCIEYLTSNHNPDSGIFSLNKLEVNAPEFGNDHLAQAIYFVRNLLAKKGCAHKDISFNTGPMGKSRSLCNMIVPEVQSSLTCYIESNLGYFLVSYDMLDTVFINYSRWD